jgi:hypothetical protein
MSSVAKKSSKLGSLASSFVVFLVISAGVSGAPRGEVVPDFSLIDVDPASSTHDQPVSPRDYLQQVSGWYFGHAT